ncbi:GIY-YIG nuclease family protein [Winogradskyella schleiferi]|uniref:GIY-YIG nuclease family protein n=1 Tax=Winogradskyella schleiferi TaxID=2686078 RepID=UPI0015B8AB45|nr:GIY-YIG nuclease family protein [Winogradskyella schleiferi]
MKFYTYILFSEQLNRYYVGSTIEVDGRLERHLSSKKGYTAKAKDWEIKYYETYNTRSEAVKSELQIKKWKSRNMIQKLINGVQ